MHPEIATLVSNVFYSDEQWQCRRTGIDDRPAVYWIDPSRFEGGCRREPGGPSWLNVAEAEVVRRLYAAPENRRGRFLAVTPYNAQRRLLESMLSEDDAGATVDGCQGIEAETVVFSFVRMAGFVLDYRRLNVAFSRAKERLFLVGNFTAFSESRFDERGKSRPHVLGLIRIFSRGGFFSDRLLTPNPDSWLPK
jgi:superfamily I DNA and/or RNA helicase